jgi:hypothetical protein
MENIIIVTLNTTLNMSNTFIGIFMVKKSDELLERVEKEYRITPEDVLSIFSRSYRSTPDEVKLFMEAIPGITPEDIFLTINDIKNPPRYKRFVSEPNDITIRDKDGNIKSEPKDWIKFGKNWYDKREVIKNQFYPDKFEINYGVFITQKGFRLSFTDNKIIFHSGFFSSSFEGNRTF